MKWHNWRIQLGLVGRRCHCVSIRCSVISRVVHKSDFIVLSCDFPRLYTQNEANLPLPLDVKRLKCFRLWGAFPYPDQGFCPKDPTGSRPHYRLATRARHERPGMGKSEVGNPTCGALGGGQYDMIRWDTREFSVDSKLYFALLKQLGLRWLHIKYKIACIIYNTPSTTQPAYLHSLRSTSYFVFIWLIIVVCSLPASAHALVFVVLLYPLQTIIWNFLHLAIRSSVSTQGSRIRSVRILFLEWYVCTLTCSILAYVNRNRIRSWDWIIV